MPCLKCGNQLFDDAPFCSKCGSAFTATPIQGGKPQQGARPEPPRYKSFQSFSPPSSQYKPIFTDVDKAKEMADGKEHYTFPHRYHKLGGWLRFFVVVWAISVVNTVRTIIYQIMRLNNMVTNTGYDGSYALILFIILAGYGTEIFIGIKLIEMILRKKPLYLLFYEIVSVVSIVIYVLIALIFNNYVDGGDVFINIVQSIISLVIMLNYFAKSVRVRTYFGSDEYLRRSIFFKNSIAPKPADTVPYGYE